MDVAVKDFRKAIELNPRTRMRGYGWGSHCGARIRGKKRDRHRKIGGAKSESGWAKQQLEKRRRHNGLQADRGIGSSDGIAPPPPSHTTGHAVFRIRRLNQGHS